MWRRASTLPVLLLVVSTTWGWLYLVRPALPGPQVAEALPLDELAKHASTPLVWYVAVWAVAALLAGLHARWAGIEPLTAALCLATGAGIWMYLANGVSIAVTRQVSMQDALDVAARLESTYLGPVLVAVAAALLATGRGRALRRTPVLVAGFVAAGASLDLLHTMLPGDDSGLLHNLTPDAAGPLARAAGALAGIVLLFAARGLARRRRRAWQVAAIVAGVSAGLHVLHGLNDGTLASVVVLCVLLARRRDFDRPGDIATRRRTIARAVCAVAAIASYGVVALWLNRVAADRPFTGAFAVRVLVQSLRGGSAHLSGDFGDWFPLSLLLLTGTAVIWIIGSWVAPWRHRVRQEDHERDVASALVRAWGVDTLAPFVLRADKSYFFNDDESAFLAYRVLGGVAIVSGDPVGSPEAFSALVGRFVARAHQRDWRVAILGASERCLPLYAAHGLHALYHGDEAVVATASFSLGGRAIRKVRQSVHRLEQAGYTARVLRPSELDAGLRADLERVAQEWRGTEPERGFVMALDALFRLGDDDAVFVVGFDDHGSVGGFLHFAVSEVASALSLSSMPRLRSTPNGFNEWLICEAVQWARANGLDRVSLNFSPFAGLLAPEAVLTSAERLQRRALLTMKGHFQLDNLLMFNRKFFPTWERRFVVYERRRDLPRVGVAALAAEAYLPFQKR